MASVVQHAQFIHGPEVGLIEKKCAEFVGRKHAIAVGSGTDALFLAYLALNVKRGDHVLTTAFSFVAAAEMLAFIGAHPVFCDIDPVTFNIDVDAVRSTLASCRSKNRTLRGIVAVDLFGQCADYTALTDLASQNDLFLIEDAAQSFGAMQKGQRAGAFGDVAITSFFPTKPLGCYGDGGMIFTDSDAVEQKCRQLRHHGQSKKYEHDCVGINSRLDTLQAAVLLAKFGHFTNHEIQMRQQVAQKYTEALQNFSDFVQWPAVHPNNTSVWAQYSIRVPRRDELVEFMARRGVPTAIHYHRILPDQSVFKSLGGGSMDFPVARKTADSILSLPMSPYVTDGEIELVAKAIGDFFK